MKRLIVAEHRTIPIGYGDGLSATEALELRRFDEERARRAGDTVFDWSHSRGPSARGYVGVVQIPGVSIEILPKVDDESGVHGVQKNLLYMLELAGVLRVRRRSLALLETERVSLLDAFAAVFADQLLHALQDGLDRNYMTFEENLRVVRGRLLVHEHVRRNSVERQRLFVSYDEFSPDTPLNRILKAACRRLARAVRSFDVLRRLREIVLRLDDVADITSGQRLPHVTFDRRNARYRPLLEFARLVLSGFSPTLSAGDERTFSLLFPMHRVFEAFVAALLRRNCASLGFDDIEILAQSGGRFLARGADGRRYLRLQPDVLGRTSQGTTKFVLDTKWKRINPVNPLAEVTQTDAYQVYAYSEQFDSPLGVLLYPSNGPADGKILRFERSERTFRIAFLDVTRDLRGAESEVVEELRGILAATTPVV